MSTYVIKRWLMVITPGIFLAGITTWFCSSAISLNPTSENVVKNSIAAEYQRYHLSRQDLSAEQKASLLQAIQKMKIRSLSARGEPQNHLIVRVEVEPTTAQPPGLSNVLYYQLKYSSLTGWASDGRTTAENYYLFDFNRLYN
ncbi:hypothetical protein [Kaarinaea lacus]